MQKSKPLMYVFWSNHKPLIRIISLSELTVSTTLRNEKPPPALRSWLNKCLITVLQCFSGACLLLNTMVIIMPWISVGRNGAATGAAELSMRLLN